MAKANPESFHPLTREFFASGGLSKVLETYKQPGEPFIEIFRTLSNALDHQKEPREAIRRAREFDPSGLPLDLAEAFWAEWAELAGRLNMDDELAAVANLMRSALPDDAAPELRALVLVYEGLSASRRGNKAGRMKLLEEASALITPESPYQRIGEVRAFFLSQLGMGDDAEADCVRMVKALGPREEPFISLTHFVHSVETLRVPQALGFMQEIEAAIATNRLTPFCQHSYAEYYNYFLLCITKWIPRGRYGPMPELRPRPGLDQMASGWGRIPELLVERRPAEALAVAREIAAREGNHHIDGIGFDTFNMIRCELACGNGEAARRIIDKRRSAGNLHYMDDLYLARVELLRGDHPAAARHAAELHKAVSCYRAEGRLELELGMACEMSPADAAFLLRAASAGPQGAGTGAAGPGASHVHAETAVTAVRPAGASLVGLARIVGASPALAAVRETIARYAPLDVPVLITGETGTGKELVARAIHECSPRATEPFLAVNCGAIAETLLESELFGHERGAFTGASNARRGIFEEAGRGTVLLDEIGDIGPRLQIALLRVLETGEIRPVGSSRTKKIDCRVVSATNAKLESLAMNGFFRKDLLFRLKRLELHIPPLRERREDILPLVNLFLLEGRRDERRPALSEALRQELLRRGWNGNVRELRNAVERMRLMNSDKLAYDVTDLESAPAQGQAAAEAAQAAQAAPLSSAAPPAQAPQPMESEAQPPREAPEPPDIGNFQEGRSPMRRQDKLRELFRRHGKLTRAEAASALGISLPTATHDLQVLSAEGFIEKICPSPSPRSHYFRRKSTLEGGPGTG